MNDHRLPANAYAPGAYVEDDGIRFSFVSGKKDCGIIIYDRVSGEKIQKYPFRQEERIGRFYSKLISGLQPRDISYHFYEEDEIVVDERARGFADIPVYGKERKDKEMKAVFPMTEFDWEGDCSPGLSYEDSIVYCMHVRGFTKHVSSGVVHRGTFLGMVEKLDYLKKIGITTIELQPAYEFKEVSCRAYNNPQEMLSADNKEQKVNYWGYQKGYYYTPKGAYAAGEDAGLEFKHMIKEFHKNGMEIIMQIFLNKDVPVAEIPEILRFWVLEYHVDGFHLMGENVPLDMILQDAFLADTKLWYYQFDTEAVRGGMEQPDYVNLAEYRDDYLYTMRRFLKGDDNMLAGALYHMRHIPPKSGRIHYMSNYYGLTLKDMVSYNYKHNEENGEGNCDGNDENCSWNCGEEGATRKKKVGMLRTSQLKNAMCMLLFSQSTPLIFMGDEFGRSQQGNNNPYCQDNRITWLDWKDLERNKELYDFWKMLVGLRKAHPILHPLAEFKIMDYIACGYPDLSYHGESAWRPGLENNYRHAGIMYCGKYAEKAPGTEDDFFYVAINMHWEPQKLALPKLPKQLKWKMLFSTVKECPVQEEKTAEEKYIYILPPRSIVVLKSEAL